MTVPGSYANGFAPRDGQPLYPELWRGCIGAWSPSLGQTGLELRDWSGFGRNCALLNSPTWGLRNGTQAINFNGTSQRVDAPLNTPIASFSVSFWVVIDTPDSRLLNYSIGTKIGSTAKLQISVGGSFGDGVSVGEKGIFLFDIATSTFASSIANTFTTANDGGAPRHIAVTYDGAITKIYKSGLQLSMLSNGISGTKTIDSIVLGNRSDSTFPMVGGMFDVRAYNRILYPHEIKQLSASPGIAYERAPRRRSRIFIGGFKAYWVARKAQIIGGGL